MGCSSMTRRPKDSESSAFHDDFLDLLKTLRQERSKLSPFPPPSNQRLWRPDLAVLSQAEFEGNRVTIRNVRNCRYRSEEDYTTFDITTLPLDSKTFGRSTLSSCLSRVHPFWRIPCSALDWRTAGTLSSLWKRGLSKGRSTRLRAVRCELLKSCTLSVGDERD